MKQNINFDDVDWSKYSKEIKKIRKQYNAIKKDIDKIEKYPIGTKIYYSLEDYDTGEPVIYKTKVKTIFIKNIQIPITKKEMKVKIYEMEDGMGMTKNAFYTLQELFDMKDRLEMNINSCDKETILKESK